MKKLIGTVLSLTLLGIMAVPAAAQGRNRYNGNQETTRRQDSRDRDFHDQGRFNDRNRRNDWGSRDRRWDNDDSFWNQRQSRYRSDRDSRRFGHDHNDRNRY
jgi:hypothetical protein